MENEEGNVMLVSDFLTQESWVNLSIFFSKMVPDQQQQHALVVPLSILGRRLGYTWKEEAAREELGPEQLPNTRHHHHHHRHLEVHLEQQVHHCLHLQWPHRHHRGECQREDIFFNNRIATTMIISLGWLAGIYTQSHNFDSWKAWLPAQWSPTSLRWLAGN